MKVRALYRLSVLIPATVALAQQPVTIPFPGRSTVITADLYGGGTNSVILAHGGRFTKESWKPQAEVLVRAGFAALAIRYRGDSQGADGAPNSTGSPEENAEDVLAAAAYLYGNGASRIAGIGASLGGDAVGDAAGRSRGVRISPVVILGSSGGSAPEKLPGPKLFIVAREDRNAWGRRLPDIKRHYDNAHEPKKLIVIQGSAHAQFLFDTDQGPYVLDQILRFLLEQ